MVAVLSFNELTGAIEHAPAPVAEAEFEVGWGGPAHKHRVIRKSDRSPVKTGFDTREQAEQWVRNHMKAVA